MPNLNENEAIVIDDIATIDVDGGAEHKKYTYTLDKDQTLYRQETEQLSLFPNNNPFTITIPIPVNGQYYITINGVKIEL